MWSLQPAWHYAPFSPSPVYTPGGQDWHTRGGTYGCIGLANRDVEEFYDYVVIGTPVVIRQ
ncbi:MAG: L,D-transpeptidase [Desulfocucumaceae bacterium]